MFELIWKLLPPLLAGTAAAGLFALPFMLARKGADLSDDKWLDHPPAFIRFIRPLLHLYSNRIESSMHEGKRQLLTGRLAEAGYSYILMPVEFIMLRRFGMLGALLLCIYMIVVGGVSNPLTICLIFTLIPLGFFYPDIWLKDTIDKRKRRIEKDFPFFLDVIILAMNAGLTFTSAIKHAVQRAPEGPLRQEFMRFIRETRTGLNRKQALEQLAARVKMPLMDNFTATLIQAAEAGGSVGAVLHEQAKQRRQERFVRAEKLANQAPVKMLLPLLALLFPITFIIIGFPLAVKFMESGVHNMLGG